MVLRLRVGGPKLQRNSLSGIQGTGVMGFFKLVQAELMGQGQNQMRQKSDQAENGAQVNPFCAGHDQALVVLPRDFDADL
jgi:hypothetical protein